MKNIILLLLIVLTCKTYARQIHDSASTETNIVLQTKTAKIKGTLSIPLKGKKFPLVIIIAGSGPTDRNGNSGSAVTSNSYRILADSLLQHNIASLRYDKRGVGESADSTIKEEDMVFETYITDAIDWVTLLKKDKRFSTIIIAGHSEGSLVGMVAAANKNADKYISISGPGEPVYETLKKQLAMQPEAIKKSCYAILDTLVSGKKVTGVPASLFSLFRPSVQPYLISWFKYDPKKEIAKLNIPVLVINGTTDIQVAVDNATNLHDACKQSKLVIIEGMTHLLKEGPADRNKNIALYNTTPNKPIKTELVEAIVNFIKAK
ncbi:MAG: alpha/beta hydrolase [Chitinophagaceae bacterium]|nr:alpha/beta hydrolase [Chitinophagaceae bacterium]